MTLAAALAIAYVCGSLPFAVLVARRSGVDILDVGTRNPGASNVYRHVGAWQGVAVFVADIAKGLVPVLIAQWLGAPAATLPLIAAAVLLGAWLPLFNRFRGGAGLAAGCGAGVALLGVWAIPPAVVGIAALVVMRSGPHAAAVGASLALVVGLLTGPDWTALMGFLVLGVMLLSRWQWVEKPLAKRIALADAQLIANR